MPVPPLGPGRSAIRTRPYLDSMESPEPRRTVKCRLSTPVLLAELPASAVPPPCARHSLAGRPVVPMACAGVRRRGRSTSRRAEPCPRRPRARGTVRGRAGRVAVRRRIRTGSRPAPCRAGRPWHRPRRRDGAGFSPRHGGTRASAAPLTSPPYVIASGASVAGPQIRRSPDVSPTLRPEFEHLCEPDGLPIRAVRRAPRHRSMERSSAAVAPPYPSVILKHVPGRERTRADLAVRRRAGAGPARRSPVGAA